MHMKKILFVTVFKPSKLAAGENYTRQLLNNLSLKHKIDLVYFKYENESSYSLECENNSNLRVLKEYKINSFTKLRSYLEKPIFFPTFRVRFNRSKIKEIKEIIKSSNYDLLFLDYGQSFELGLFCDLNKILMAHDVLSQRYERHNKFLGLWASWTERHLLNQEKSIVFTFSEKDQALVKSRYNVQSNITGFFLDNDVLISEPKSISDYFVFFARWSRKDNSEGLIWFFDHVYPLLKTSIQFKIIGAGLSNEIKSRISFENVHILDFVENPYDIIKDSKALIAPLFNGAGVKVKVVESLACGVPVIGNEISFEGINSQFQSFMRKCNTPAQYVDCINTLDINLEERMTFKKMFISADNSNNILDFIDQF